MNDLLIKSKTRPIFFRKALLWFFLLLFGCMGGKATAQDATNPDARVSINKSNVSIKTLLADIEQQTGFAFFYNTQLVDVQKQTSINVSNKKLSDVLSQLFEKDNISFKVMGKQIALYPKNSDEETVSELVAQAQSGIQTANVQNTVSSQQKAAHLIKGTITDSQDNTPIEFVTVMLKGTKTYALTDAKGNYSIGVDALDGVLVFSLMGYEIVEGPINGKSLINVTMKPEIKMLEDVVVTGYTSISKERATGAFNTVKSDMIEKSHSSDLSTALLGTTAGMQGKENADGTIEYQIRGVASLYANEQPLVVVDGFPVANGFKDINPNDVENVTVLKDAAAASIWGARSANGVIVVTTKKSSKKGGVNVEANMMFRISEKLDLSTVLTTASSADQVAYEKMAYEKGWIKASSVADNIRSLTSPLSLAKEYLYAYDKGTINKTELDRELGRLSTINNRDQIKDLLLQNAVTQQYNVTASNSTERAQNYLSVMYENSKGNLISNGTDRWRINFNNQTGIFKWLDLSVGVNLHYANSDFSGPTVSDLATLAPYEMILDDDGSYATQLRKNRQQLAQISAGTLPYDDWNYNILREVRGRKYTEQNLNTRLQAGLLVKFMEGLTFDTKFQYELNKAATDLLDGEDTYYARNMVNTYLDYTAATKTVNAQFIPKGGILRSTTAQAENYTWRNQLNFDKTLNTKHQINAIGGLEISEYSTTGRSNPYVYGYDPDKNTSAQLPFGATSFNKNGQKVQIKNIMGDNIKNIEGWDGTPSTVSIFSYGKDRYVSAYANFSYTFDKKYSLSASARSDASNLITDNARYRWAPLWSVGGLWNVHNEAFMQGSKTWLDRFAFRLTYGLNGNVEKSTSPLTLLSMSSAPLSYTGFYTGYVTDFGNPNLRWEKTSTANIGVDFALFSHLLFGSIDLYNKHGEDIVGKILVSSALGTSSQKMNNAEISNKGIEVALGANIGITSKIGFSTKLTYAYNKNEVLNLYSPTFNPYQVVELGEFVQGYPSSAVWAYKYEGMENGIAYIEGPNDTKRSISSVTSRTTGLALDVLQYMGSGTDPHTLGWTGNFSGYGFNLSFLVTGKFGGHFRAPTFNSHISAGSNDVVSQFISDVYAGSEKIPSWQPDNTTLNLLWYEFTKYFNTLVESSSFIKMKEITLDYTMPKQLTAKIGLDRIKVYGQLRDLGCLWTANEYGYDPEWLPGSSKPSMSYVFGLTINF